MADISIYNSIFKTKGNDTIPIDIFLENIKEGYWQDIVNPIRCIEDKKERDTLKQKTAPIVTLSGKFTERNDNGIEYHSGFIGMDFDDCDPEKVKEKLSKDKYCFAAFTSISGRGVCAIFKVSRKKHREAFSGLSEYIYNKYKEPTDPTSINISRARFISYDPHIFINYNPVEIFTEYPKSKPPKKIDKTIYAPDDFQSVLNQIIANRINLVENYHEWLRIAFALVHQFGAAGESYFHIISQYSSKYEPLSCEKQYKSCLNHKGSNEATIALFYYYAKQAGLSIYSERTKKIAYSSIHGKKGGLSVQQVIGNLEKFESITGEDVEAIVQQVINNNIEINEDTLIDQVEIYIRQNYSLRRNDITRYIENNGVIIKQKDLNTIYIKAKKIFNQLNYELLDRLINSDFVPTYNPFLEFIEENKDRETNNCITTFLSSVVNRDPEYFQYFGRKWLVSIISAIHGIHSPLMLVLTGEVQGTGKTEWFRNLLPKELRAYYAESKLDAGKDDEILMTQKLLIMDDEMGGKSKKESKRLKELTSKAIFSLREPYGRNNVDIVRLAVLAGTTNDNEILSDTTGNRRTIPVIVTKIDFDIYNSVDKTDLFIEAYKLYKEGFIWQVLGNDIKYLRQDEGLFEVSNSEAELIQKYFPIPAAGQPTEKITATDIKVKLERLSGQKLILDRIGKELKRLGFVQEHIKEGRGTKRYYTVLKSNTEQTGWNINNDGEENVPF